MTSGRGNPFQYQPKTFFSYLDLLISERSFDPGVDFYMSTVRVQHSVFKSKGDAESWQWKSSQKLLTCHVRNVNVDVKKTAIANA